MTTDMFWQITEYVAKDNTLSVLFISMAVVAVLSFIVTLGG